MSTNDKQAADAAPAPSGKAAAVSAPVKKPTVTTKSATKSEQTEKATEIFSSRRVWPD